MAEQRKYPHNVLEGFGNGALLDLRVRFAMQMCTHSPMIAVNGAPPQELARAILDFADALMNEADARGWIDPIPADAEIDADLRDQAKRTAEYQASQQVHGNAVATKMMQVGQPTVIPAWPRLVTPGRH